MKKTPPSLSQSVNIWGAARIAGIYLILGALWILLSDKVAAEIAPEKETLRQISTYKGWGYILVTALLLYLLIQNHTRRVSQTKKELHKSEEIYWDLFNNASDGIFIANSDGQLVMVNEKACKLTGYGREELLSMNASDLITREELERAPLKIVDLRKGEIQVFERNLTHKDGSRIICEVSANLLPDGRSQSIVRDITERRVSQSALARSEERYRFLFENMTSGFARCQMVYDEQGVPIDFIYLDVNNAFRKLPGLQNVVGKRITDLVPGIRETNPELFEIYGRVASTGKPEQFESYLPGLGSGIWFSISVYSTEKGFFVAIFEIITERKQAEKKLKESESRYRELVQNANNAIIRWKSDGTISFFNEYAQAFFGYSNDEIIGRDVNILVPKTESTGGDLSKLVENIVAHPEQFVNVINENVRSDGRRVWVAWTNKPVYNENGEMTEILAVGMDITQRKRAEDALARSHKQLLSFIEQAPISIAMFDREMNYLATSHRWVTEFGRGHKDLIRLNHYEINPDLPEHWKEAHRAGLAGKSRRNDDDLWVQTDGTKFWLSWAVSPWTDENGKIGGIIISREDISERKRAEAAAFQSEMRYHRVLDAMMEGCQIIDFDWRYAYVNDVVTQQVKHTPKELLGRTMMEMYPGIEQTELFAVLQKCMADREQHRMENKFIFPDGSVGWFELSIQPAQEGLFILSTEITERKQMEESLRLENERFLRFVESNIVGIVIADATGKIILANDYYLDLLGVTRQDFLDGKVDWRKFTPPEWLPADEKAIQELSERGVCEPYEKEYIRTDGNRVSVYLADAMLPGPEKQIAAFVLDITGRKRAEAEIIRLNEELERRVIERTSQLDAANKELEAFAYSVSHDLRAPLRAIDGFTRILMDDYAPALDAEGKRICNIISHESERMGQLIEDLLVLSRLSRREMHSAGIDMQSMVESVLEELTNAEDRKRIELKLDAVPPAVGDTALMRQVWINLLANAIKFTSKKKRTVIKVGGTQEEDELIYYVRDNGAGFEMEYVDKLFNVFQRLHSDSEFEGTGVGLAIVQRVIHRHGGRVWAEGKVDQGAAFYFSLPLMKDEND